MSTCNQQAFLPSGRTVQALPATVVGNQYTFSYLISNQSPAVSNVIFCINCSSLLFPLSSSNTSVAVTGNPGSVAVPFAFCSPPGCESSAPNRFSVEYDFGQESQICSQQGLKVNLNPASSITSLRIDLIFTVPIGLTLAWQAGTIRIKSGQTLETTNTFCLPGCISPTGCQLRDQICQLYEQEARLLEAKAEIFAFLGQLILPPDLDLAALPPSEASKKIRQLSRLEAALACLNCSSGKVLTALKNLSVQC